MNHMYLQLPNTSLQGVVTAYAVGARKQADEVPKANSASADHFTRTTAPQPKSPATPRFGLWGAIGTVLNSPWVKYTTPIVGAGLKWGNQRLDESMRQDERRRNRRIIRYSESERKEVDGPYYRYVTTHKAYDGNGDRVRSKDYVSKTPWFKKASRRRYR